jgi:hypothetical protein
MKKKLNVFLFANDERVKNKAVQMIDNMPCLVRIVRAFQDLSYEYSIKFVVYCFYEEIEYIEDEMSRWLEKDVSISYISVENKSMQSSFFYNYIHSSLFHSTNLVYITSLHFPLIDSSMIKNFIDSYTNRPILLCGHFEKKLIYWKQYFPSIEETDNNLISLQWKKENPKKFLYSCIMDEQYFQNLFNIPSNLVYYHCILWNKYFLPQYFFQFEGLPFVTENDVKYLESASVRKRNIDLSIYLQKLWNKLKSIEEQLK